MVNNSVDSIISPVIPSEFPRFYQSDGPMFIEFVRAYYSWLEQSSNSEFIGSITTESRNLPRYWDIDTTDSKLLKYFQNTFLANIPKNIPIDTRFLVKHILDFYNSKGTVDGMELLFEMLFNQNISVNIPGQYMFRLSNGIWNIPKYIELTDNPYLNQLNGKLIRSSSGSTAVVENYTKKIVNGKIINVLYISDLVNDFNFNDLIYCDSFPGMSGLNAPIVTGSLSTITIENGGVDFSVGDVLNVTGSGSEGLARVSAVTNENGKVSFNLINGGFGFSANAVISIDNTGTGGTGASFQIGGLTNQQIISLNTDVIDNIYNTVLDLSVSGYEIDITNNFTNFLTSEYAQGTALSLHLNITMLTGSGFVSNGETVFNSALGISPMTIYNLNGQDIYLTGNSQALNNSNLVSGIILTCSDLNTTFKVLYVSDVDTIYANGIVNYANPFRTSINVSRPDAGTIGYYIPGMTITGNVSGSTAIVTSCKRLTDWSYFPVVEYNNLDNIIEDSFTTETKIIGSISYITNENPGSGYASGPSVSIVEPLIYNLRIDDGKGGYWGYDANVSTSAGIKQGVVTALSVIDSGFGWYPDEYLVLSNANNNSSVFGRSIIKTTGIGVGYWNNAQSFLDDVMVIQDDYYYQVYSYEIMAELMLNTYESIVKNLAHPVGYALFGKYRVNRQLSVPIGLVDSSIIQEPVVIFYTADSVYLTSDIFNITVDQYAQTNNYIEDVYKEEIDTFDGNILSYDTYHYMLSLDENIITDSNGNYVVTGD
jgi:hypothetical protein